MFYINRLGLKEDPFKNNDSRYFFADSNRMQIQSSIGEQIDSSINLQVIIGEKGLGKTLLMNSIVADNWYLGKITAVEKINTLALIESILCEFHAPEFENQDLIEVLETRLASIAQQGLKPVLMIDDADFLSSEAIRFLLQLSQQKQDNKPYLSIVLFAGPDIIDYLQSSDLIPFRDVIHIVTLSRLDKDSTADYLKHRLAVAGFDRVSPFTPRVVVDIYNDSEGIPEKINLYASRFLEQSGKGEDYIKVLDDSAEFTTGSDTELPVSGEEFLDSRMDNAEAQLNLLTEQFDEIEEARIEDENEQQNTPVAVVHRKNNTTQSGTKAGKAKKLMYVAIPVFLLLLVAVYFKITTKEATETGVATDISGIDYLPLDLPTPEAETKLPPKQGNDSLTVERSEKQQPVSASKTTNQVTGTAPETEQPVELAESVAETTPAITKDEAVLIASDEIVVDSENASIETKELELIVPGDASFKSASLDGNEIDKEAATAIRESIMEKTLDPEVKAKKNIPALAQSDELSGLPLISTPNITAITPEPLIGSSKAQAITIIGTNLSEQASILLNKGSNTEQYSAQLTPGKWQFKNNKITIYVETGTAAATFSVKITNPDGAYSETVEFDIVRPYIARSEVLKVIPEQLIGSFQRQEISVKGKGFSPDTQLEVRWDDNSKIFSKNKTPDQWLFVDNETIQLKLATGTTPRKWQIRIASEAGNSEYARFEIVNKIDFSLQEISPNPLPASNSRQKLTLTGSGFSQKTEVRLQWDDNWKIFSKQLTPEQFIYVDSSEINLFITTGTNERKWLLSLKNPGIVVSPQGSFLVARNASVVSENNDVLNDQQWIMAQNNALYTIQLFGSYKKQAINELINQYKLEGELAWFVTTRKENPWYSLIYGRFETKEAAMQAMSNLPEKLQRTNPWMRTFQSIKQQLQMPVTNTSIESKSESKNNKTSAIPKKKTESWVWTQNPSAFTLQLVTLQNKNAILEYIAANKLEDAAAYIRTIQNGVTRYILIYGVYKNKEAAMREKSRLATLIKSEPWVRSFADIHGLMN